MNRSSKKYIVYLSIFVGLLVLIASGIAYFNEERVRNITINQLNNLLETEVSVEEIEFSLLRKFPKASIHFKNVEIKEKSTSDSPGTLIKASSLFMEFHPLDLLSQNYTIDVISLENAQLILRVFRDGSNNFQFINKEAESEEFKISLNKVSLKNTKLNYRDDYNHIYFLTDLHSLSLTGEFESNEFDLSVAVNGHTESFSLNSFKSKRAHDFELDLELAVNKLSHLYSFNNAQVTIGPLSFFSEGSYQKNDEGSDMNINFNTRSFSFQEVSNSLPDNLKKKLAKYQIGGSVKIGGSVIGKLDKYNSPAVNLAFSLENGELKHKETEVSLKDLGIKGTLTNGKEHKMESSRFDLTEVHFTGKHGKSEGSLSIKNFSRPYLNFEFSSILDLTNLKKFIDNDSLEMAEGIINYYIKAGTSMDSISELTLRNLQNMHTEGTLSLTNAAFKWKGYQHTISEINSRSRFGNNVIYIDSLHYKMGDMVTEFKGKFSNFLPYLFFENEKMRAQAEIYYPNLDVNKLQSDNNSKTSGFILPVSPFVELNLRLKADNFAFRKFEAKNVSGVILSKYPYFIVEHLELNAMEGAFKGWLQFDVNDLQNINFSSELALQHVNIQTLFYQFENFGQKEILSENINGFANASLDARGALNKDYKVISESIEANSHIEVSNGRLVNYETILALSDYIDVEELKDIQFSKLTNDIQVKNKTVIIPEMEIQSSALELWLAGKQTFDGQLDYHFTLWLNDFLFKKAKRSKKKKEDFGEVEMDKEGRSKLFLHMTGTVDDYKIKLDKKAMREKWNEDLKQERQELKDLFRNEFSKDSKKSTEAPMRIDIEWEELEDEPKNDHDSKESTDKKDDKVKDKEPSIQDKLGGKKIEDEYEEYDPDKFD